MKKIYESLKGQGVNIFFPGQHRGLCDKPYAVLHQGAQISQLGTNKLGQQSINIIVYAPISSFIKAEAYCADMISKCKAVLRLRKTGFETAWVIEDEIKAYSKSIEYVLQKELEG